MHKTNYFLYLNYAQFTSKIFFENFLQKLEYSIKYDKFLDRIEFLFYKFSK